MIMIKLQKNNRDAADETNRRSVLQTFQDV